MKQSESQREGKAGSLKPAAVEVAEGQVHKSKRWPQAAQEGAQHTPQQASQRVRPGPAMCSGSAGSLGLGIPRLRNREREKLLPSEVPPVGSAFPV